MAKRKNISEKDFLVYNYRSDNKTGATGTFVPAIYRPIASHLPRHIQGSTESFCREKSCPLLEKECEISKDAFVPMTFECLSVADRFREGDSCYGDRLLGCLKADVDNLGKFLHEKVSHFSISEFFQLSYLLDYFFSGVIPYILEECVTRNYNNVYVLYSGGDDLFFIGPWYTMLNLAWDIRNWFGTYVFENGNLGLSMGLVFVKPKTPIKWMAKKADELLRMAKSGGKDSIVIGFGEEPLAFSWREVRDRQFVSFEELLKDLILSKQWSRSRLNNLLRLGSDARGTVREDQPPIESFLYLAHLKYMLSRDFDEEKRKDPRINELWGKLLDYFSPSSGDLEKKVKEMFLATMTVLTKTRRC